MKARADALGIWGACVAIARCVGFTLAAFVDGAVAVVVFVIAADFSCGGGGVARLELTVYADFVADPALGLTLFLDFIVDLAVAVVIFAVADFCLGKLLL